MNKVQEKLSLEQELDNNPIAINKEYENNSFNWLTDHSRNFLSAGYIPEGTTPEGRIKEIAERAEEILQIEGFADKFYKYMEQGFFSLSSPVWSNFGKKRAALVLTSLMTWATFFILNLKLE